MAIDNTSNRFFYLRAAMKFGFWNGVSEPTSFYGPINFTKFEISTPKQKMTRLMSNMDGSFGDLLDSQPSVTDPPAFSCEFDSMTGDMLSLLLGANTSDLSQTTGAVTDEVITPVLGVWQRLANKYIAPHVAVTSPIVFKDGAATPAVVPLENFELDLVNGMYRALTALGATAETVSYHKATRTGEIYDAGLAQNRYVQFAGTALEMATNKRCLIQVHKASLMPSGKFDPVSNAYLKGGLEGDLLLPTGFVSPWRFEYLDMSA